MYMTQVLFNIFDIYFKYLIMLSLLMIIKLRIEHLIFFDLKENKLINIASETIQ